MKLFSPKVHGVLDYVTAVSFVVLPYLFGVHGNARKLLFGNAAGVIGYSLLTCYDYGAIKLLPMRTHLGLDALSSLSFLSTPLWVKEGRTVVQATLVGIGLFEALVITLTDPSNRQAPPPGKTQT
jgi:hypothetical protein